MDTAGQFEEDFERLLFKSMASGAGGDFASSATAISSRYAATRRRRSSLGSTVGAMGGGGGGGGGGGPAIARLNTTGSSGSGGIEDLLNKVADEFHKLQTSHDQLRHELFLLKGGRAEGNSGSSSNLGAYPTAANARPSLQAVPESHRGHRGTRSQGTYNSDTSSDQVTAGQRAGTVTNVKNIQVCRSGSTLGTVSRQGTAVLSRIGNSIVQGNSVALVPTGQESRFIWPASVERRAGLPKSSISNAAAFDWRSSCFSKIKSESMYPLGNRGRRSGPKLSYGNTMVFENQNEWCPTLHPDSRFVMGFESLGLFMVVYEVLATPFVLAWSVNPTGLLRAISWVISTYWIIEFIINFNKGMYLHGQLITSRRGICSNYLRGWFIIDLVLLIGDVVVNVYDSAIDPSQDEQPIIRVSRVLRLLKFLRISRMFRFVNNALYWSLSVKSRLAVQLISLISIVIVCGHVLSCMWWTIGTVATSDGPGWVETYSASEEDIIYQYLTALHWTVAQMTLGAMDVNPVNSQERVFTVGMLMIALLLGSSLISLMSAVLVNAVMQQQRKNNQLKTLRSFLLQERISSELSAEVQRQVMDRLGQTDPIEESAVECLEMLPRSMQMEICYFTRMPLIMASPLFRIWASLDASSVRSVCSKVMNFKHLRDKDDLFLVGEYALGAYIVVFGDLSYVQRPSSSMVDFEEKTDVKAGAWVCEAGLWCEWWHVGTISARSRSKICFIGSQEFARVVESYTPIREVTLLYARNFHLRVTMAIPPNADWPNDLRVPNTEAVDLLTPEVDLGLLKSATHEGKLTLTLSDHAELVREIQNGKCTLQFGEEGDLVRTVTIAALRIVENNGSRILVTIGRSERLDTADKGFVACCSLPTTKRTRGELPHEAIKRLVRSDLLPFSGRLNYVLLDHESETLMEGRFGMETIYLRTVQLASFDEGQQAEMDLPKAVFDKDKINHDDHDDHLLDVVQNDVYYIPDGKRICLYVWLMPYQFDRLRSPSAARHLQAWLDALSLPDFQAHL